MNTIVKEIAQRSGRLLEIVNYNVDGQQYVCAGHVSPFTNLSKFISNSRCYQMQTLHCLRAVLKWISVEKLSSTMLRDLDNESLKGSPLFSAVSSFLTTSLAQKLPIDLIHYIGYTPLRGIDMPFHSSFFRAGIPGFRDLLLEHIRETDVQPAELIDKYIPNVTARPFKLTKEYFASCYELTKSQKLREILEQVRPFLAATGPDSLAVRC